MKIGLACVGLSGRWRSFDASMALVCVANGLPASTAFEPEMTLKELMERLEAAQKAKKS